MGGFTVESVTSGERFECSDIYGFKKIFWLLCINCVIIYGCVFPFNNIAGDFFQEKWDYSESEANLYLGVPFTISAIASPFLGGIVDKIGQRSWLFLFASICLTLSHAMMGFTKIVPLPWLIVLGSAYS